MKPHVFHGKITDTVDVTTSNETWQLAGDGRIVDVEIGILALYPNENSTIIVDGTIKATDSGVKTGSVGGHVIVGKHGLIQVAGNASDGVYFDTNEGASVVNSGTIEAGNGISMVGHDLSATNNKGGVIKGVTYGISMAGYEGDRNVVVNHGLIRGGSEAAGIIASEANDKIVNDGRIVGNILLFDGDDVIDTRGGTIKGFIQGGGGDDTLITSDARITLLEDPATGNDTVKSTVSYTLTANVENLFLLGNKNIKGVGTGDANQIHGNGGDNLLKGLGGNDKLFGGKGDDRLVGGADGDFFQFATGWGHDRVVDFEQGADLVDVTKWKGIDDFTDVFKHAHDTKDGVTITLGHDSLTIAGMTRAELVGGDFMF